MPASVAQDDYDSPWKEAVEHVFPEFIDFYFPDASRQIDWARGHTFLDKELQQIVRDAELGRRHVDKLACVTTHAGEEDWLCVHIEVQGSVDHDFARRMFVYNYRIFDTYDRPVASLAVLGLAMYLPGRAFGPVSQSVMAAFAHIGGQLLVARAWLVPHDGVFYLVPVFALAATLFGLVNGLIAARLLQEKSAPPPEQAGV